MLAVSYVGYQTWDFAVTRIQFGLIGGCAFGQVRLVCVKAKQLVCVWASEVGVRQGRSSWCTSGHEMSVCVWARDVVCVRARDVGVRLGKSSWCASGAGVKSEISYRLVFKGQSMAIMYICIFI